VKRLYLAHPISGKSEQFMAEVRMWAGILREEGFGVYCPAEQNMLVGLNDVGAPLGSADQRALFAADLLWICSFADGIALYDGWQDSRGCTAEAALATAIGIPAHPMKEWLQEGAPDA